MFKKLFIGLTSVLLASSSITAPAENALSRYSLRVTNASNMSIRIQEGYWIKTDTWLRPGEYKTLGLLGGIVHLQVTYREFNGIERYVPGCPNGETFYEDVNLRISRTAVPNEPECYYWM